LALDVYAKKMERQRDTGARIDALLGGADWALMGADPREPLEFEPPLRIENPAGAGLSSIGTGRFELPTS
jgi:hypothetical protein